MNGYSAQVLLEEQREDELEKWNAMEEMAFYEEQEQVFESEALTDEEADRN